MARYKPVERGGIFIPVVVAEQIQPGPFGFALDHWVDHGLELSQLDARFRNDATDASAYDLRVMLKIVLLGDSRGLISARCIEQACQRRVLFMALSGDAHPNCTHIAKFIRELGLADAGYCSDDTVRSLHDQGIPALIADTGMRQRDERFARQQRHKDRGEALYNERAVARPIELYQPEDFEFLDETTARCPAGKTLRGSGTRYAHSRGAQVLQHRAGDQDCTACERRHRCLKKPEAGRGRQVGRLGRAPVDENDPSERMRRAIDSPRGRRLYGQRIAAVEPVFANISHHKGIGRFTLRGQAKVSTQWQPYCPVHQIEKMAHRGAN